MTSTDTIQLVAPRTDYTDITVILDKSGSMSAVKNDTIGGFNQFIEEQKQVPGKATLTLIQFDTNYEISYNGKNVQEVEPLTDKTYRPNGGTALLDAIGRGIQEATHRFADMAEDQRPSKVVFVIQTDGEENSSREFNNEQIKKMIEDQKITAKWEFVFLGATMDTFTTAMQLGIAAGNTIAYANNGIGTSSAIGAMSKNLADYRNMAKMDMSFTAVDYAEQDKLKTEI